MTLGCGSLLPPQAPATNGLLSVSVIFAASTIHMQSLIPWLISLTIMLLRFIHV